MQGDIKKASDTNSSLFLVYTKVYSCMCVYDITHAYLSPHNNEIYTHTHRYACYQGQSRAHGVEDRLYIHCNYCLQDMNGKTGLDHLTPLKEIKARPDLDILKGKFRPKRGGVNCKGRD